MRLQPSMTYSYNTPKHSNMTLFEMAESMSENSNAQEAFPYFINWLLKDFWSNYKYNGIPYSEEYAYNIAYFTIYNFLNREICNKKPEVFRTKYLKEIVNMNLEKDFYSLLDDLRDATADLTKERILSDDTVNDKTNTQTNNLTEASDASSNVSTSSSSSASSDASNSSVVTNNLKRETSDSADDTTTYDVKDSINSSNTSDSTKREVLTDYPQSTVNTSVVGSWNYASGANDTTTHSSDSGSSTDSKTGTEQLNHTRTETSSDTGTVDTTGSNSIESEGSTESASDATSNLTVKKTGTVSNEENQKTNKNINEKITWQGLTGLDINKTQLELYKKYGSFYNKLLNRLENCFISIYIDSDRDGWLDPTVNLLSQW